jgi:hypothetical protein
MSLSLINKTNVGKLFISNDKNYLVKEVVYVNDDLETITATLVNCNGEEVFFNGAYSQWFEGLVK